MLRNHIILSSKFFHCKKRCYNFAHIGQQVLYTMRSRKSYGVINFIALIDVKITIQTE